jgi:hypothetical protein
VPIPTIRARLLCRVDGAPVEPLQQGLEDACELRSLLDPTDPERPVVVAYISSEVIKAQQRRGGHGPYPSDGVWAEVWTSSMQPTPYSLFVRDGFDADEQLEYLSAALKPRGTWTIKPPRGWMGYGIPPSTER